MLMPRFPLFLLVILTSLSAWSYPEFIGYGYSSCLTCHVNGLGGGPLNDYGRALWSAEIASRAFYPRKITDEDIANQSGFLGTKQLPSWLRPHAKYRGINVRQNPGSSTADSTRFAQMQLEAGLTLQADPDGKYTAVMTWGQVTPPEDHGGGTQGMKRILATEYYLRTETAKTWWVYAGLMEKAYGIRNIDHTSFQRTFQGFNRTNNSMDGAATSLGLIVQKVEERWELAANAFFGHPEDDNDYKQKGFSLTGEGEVGEKKRLGASVLSASSELLKKNLYAVHYRQGLSKGSAFMFEYGLIQDEEQLTGVSRKGSYNLLQGLILLTRGYNLKATIERYNREFKADEPDLWKWSAGLLMFPAPRLELRADVLNIRSFSKQRAADDQWAVLGQVHVSL